MIETCGQCPSGMCFFFFTISFIFFLLICLLIWPSNQNCFPLKYLWQSPAAYNVYDDAWNHGALLVKLIPIRNMWLHQWRHHKDPDCYRFSFPARFISSRLFVYLFSPAAERESVYLNPPAHSTLEQIVLPPDLYRYMLHGLSPRNEGLTLESPP